ncbi:MAG: response regulator transcription factor [Vulcanimicrobiota bacterium]
MNLLLVDDEPAVLASLRRRLQMEGFKVATAVTGLMALEEFHSQPIDLVILDVMLPELGGFEVAEKIRSVSAVPILMLTARDAVADRVQGLERGADDYLVKPFAFEELLARIRALLRRAKSESAPTGEILRAGHWSLNKSSYQAYCGSELLTLTPREFELMAYFLSNPNQVLTRERIFSQVWGHDYEGSSNVIDVYVRSLRDKLEGPEHPRMLHTVRGLGYILRT